MCVCERERGCVHMLRVQITDIMHKYEWNVLCVFGITSSLA